MAFEVKRTGAVEYGVYMKMLLCSHPGAGKTPFSATAPNPFFIVLDNGMMSIASQNLPFVELDSTDQLREIGQALAQPPNVREKRFGAPVDTVVIETIDWVQRLFKNEYMKEKRLDSMNQQGWGWLGDRMQDFALAYLNLPLNVIFNCHLTDKKDEQAGDIFETPSLQGAFGNQAPELLDLVLLMKSETKSVAQGNKVGFETRRWIQTYQDPRHLWIKDRSGKLPPEFEVNFKDDWTRMEHLIYGDIRLAREKYEAELAEREVVAVPIVEPTPEVEPVSEVPVEISTGAPPEVIDALAEQATAGSKEPADPEVIKELVDAMEGITDETWRKTVKVGFFEKFGKPDDLQAGQVDEARALVQEMLA